MLLPKSFTNKIINTSGNYVNIRSNIRNMDDCNKWVREYGEVSNTQWNSRTSNPNGQKMVCSKKFVCHHSSFMKVSPEINKRSVSKNSSCPAVILMKVKLENTRTKQTDSFLKEGMPGVITIKANHNHNLDTAESLRCLPASTSTDSRDTFLNYFNKGMTVAVAHRYHQSVLLQKRTNEMEMANSRINPSMRRVRHWYGQWSIGNPVSRIKKTEEEDTDPPTLQQCLQTRSIKQEPTSDDDCPGENNQNMKKEQLQEVTIKKISNECNRNQITEEEKLRKEFLKLFGDILEKFNPSVTAMKKALAYLKTIKSKEQCEAMLHNLGKNISLHRNVVKEKNVAAIMIQRFRSIAPKPSKLNKGYNCHTSVHPDEIVVPDLQINLDYCLNS